MSGNLQGPGGNGDVKQSVVFLKKCDGTSGFPACSASFFT